MIAFVGAKDDMFIFTQVVKQEEFICIPIDSNLKALEYQICQSAADFAVIYSVDKMSNDAAEIVGLVTNVESKINCKSVVLAKGYKPKSHVIKALYYAGVKNFVLGVLNNVISDEIEKCFDDTYETNGVPFENEYLSEEPPRKETSDNNLLAEIEAAKKQRLHIGVAGGRSHIGCTTICVQIAKYLESIGFKACIVEINASGYFQAYCENLPGKCFKENKNTNTLDILNLTIFTKLPTERQKKNYDFIIYDYGSYDSDYFQNNLKTSFYEKDICLFVNGAKPNEEPYLIKTLEDSIELQNIYYLFNFCTPASAEDLYASMESKADHTLVITEYIGDMFRFQESQTLTEQFQIIFSRYLPADHKKPKRFWFRKKKEGAS